MATNNIINQPKKITNAKAIQRKSRGHEVTQLTATTYQVKSGASGSLYTVTLQNQGATCTCEWGAFRKRRDPRSGCSHVVSVYSEIAEWTGRTVSAWSSEEDAARQHRPTINIGDGLTLTTRKAEPILVNWPTGVVMTLDVAEVL